MWFPALRAATREQRLNDEIGGGGISLHWAELDEDLLIAGLMAGVDRDRAEEINTPLHAAPRADRRRREAGRWLGPG